MIHGRKDKVEVGIDRKVGRYDREAFTTKMQRQCNMDVSTACVAKEMISGLARTIERPLLYPAGHLNHNMVLAMEGKPARPTLRQEAAAGASPYALWDQSMYIPHSRTRTDFPRAKRPGTGNSSAITPADTTPCRRGTCSHSYRGPSPTPSRRSTSGPKPTVWGKRPRADRFQADQQVVAALCAVVAVLPGV